MSLSSASLSVRAQGLAMIISTIAAVHALPDSSWMDSRRSRSHMCRTHASFARLSQPRPRRVSSGRARQSALWKFRPPRSHGKFRSRSAGNPRARHRSVSSETRTSAVGENSMRVRRERREVRARVSASGKSGRGAPTSWSWSSSYCVRTQEMIRTPPQNRNGDFRI